jgi:hypothetical protein
MKIRNIDGLSAGDLQLEVSKGGRFIYYAYTISFLVVTFKRVSGVYLVRGDESRVRKGLGFSLISFFFGWWGFPSGPKHTVESLSTNLKGGKDVTDDVMAVVEGYVLFHEVQAKKSA